jgi:CheY-like chemotaxis protein
MKGAIDVDSTPGAGTCFRILLPLAADDAQVAQPQEEPEQHMVGEACILVVDDEETMRCTVRDMLTDLGYEVFTAVDGQDGVEVFQAHRDRVDLVLLDMVMPRMNGPECFRAIRDIRADVPFVIASGYAEDGMVEELTRDPRTVYVTKPFRCAKLNRVFRALLDHGR